MHSSEYVIEYDDIVLRMTASSDETMETHAPKLERGCNNLLEFGVPDNSNIYIELEARGSKSYTLERVLIDEFGEIRHMDVPEITTVSPSKTKQVQLTCDMVENRGQYSGWQLKSMPFGQANHVHDFFTFIFLPESGHQITWDETDIFKSRSKGYSQRIQVNIRDFRLLKITVQKLTEIVDNLVREKASGLHTLEQMHVHAQTSSGALPYHIH